MHGNHGEKLRGKLEYSEGVADWFWGAQVDEDPNTHKISLGLSVIVRVTLKDGTFHEVRFSVAVKLMRWNITKVIRTSDTATLKIAKARQRPSRKRRRRGLQTV